jgi:hypothetical protein
MGDMMWPRTNRGKGVEELDPVGGVERAEDLDRRVEPEGAGGRRPVKAGIFRARVLQEGTKTNQQPVGLIAARLARSRRRTIMTGRGQSRTFVSPATRSSEQEGLGGQTAVVNGLGLGALGARVESAVAHAQGDLDGRDAGVRAKGYGHGQ